MSPITIHKLMSMVFSGSPGKSDTFKQLEKALHLKSGPGDLQAYKDINDQYDAISSNKSSGSTMKLAMTMISQYGFTIKEDFKSVLRKYFGLNWLNGMAFCCDSLL